MKLTSSQEDYLKTIYLLEKSNQKVRVTDIAIKLKITKPSVNKAINTLKELGVIHYQAYGNITLTEEGERQAVGIIKRQDILEMFLTELLDIEKQQAEKEATAMKHAISEETIQKLNHYITKVMNLENIDCDYDETSEKCRNCIKIKANHRLKNKK